MSTNILEFSAEIDLFNQNAIAQFRRIVKRSVFAIHRRLLTEPKDYGYGTPRDTARAVSSWFVTVNQPSKEVILELPKKPKEKPKYSTKRAEETLNEIDFTNPFKIFYITNNVDYIVALNDGTVNQPARHFVEQAVNFVCNEIKSKGTWS